MATRTAASASYADVNTAYGLCTYGDTLVVPAGTETWTDPLSVTKGIRIQGAGIGLTNITCKASDDGIYYVPDATERASQSLFEVTGFTWLGTPYACVDMAETDAQTVPMTKIRIHHNRFENTSGYPIRINGNFWGCCDQNQFAGAMFFIILGNDPTNWTTFYPIVYGTANNMYFEDNTFEGTSGVGIQSEQGSRWCWRYNNMANDAALNPVYDFHGYQETPVLTANMFAEIYGNLITHTENAARWFYQRGGNLLAFNNRYTSPSGMPDAYIDNDTDAPEPPIQHPYMEYFWNNWYNGAIRTIIENNDVGNHIAENSQFWNYNASFDGSAGMGCGTLVQMNAITPTAVGVGYWVTDYSPASTPPTTLADLRTYCQAGKLYRANASLDWELFYQPYTYPHPLRGEGANPWVMIYG